MTVISGTLYVALLGLVLLVVAGIAILVLNKAGLLGEKDGPWPF
jgi:hypothetical protein